MPIWIRLLVGWSLLVLFLANTISPAAAEPSQRPNILWITCEDTGPQLGCYGDNYATTPNLNRFAERSLKFTRCWSNAPVCAPARTTLIAGLYPTAYGAQHMRSSVDLPKGTRYFARLDSTARTTIKKTTTFLSPSRCGTILASKRIGEIETPTNPSSPSLIQR
jgi:hypothetical protein